VKDATGRVVWDNDAFAFLGGDCPQTANPSLWRQSQLCARHGLFEVTDGIYQVRGLDLSNMTIVEGDRGVIVIDPLISTEIAAAALALYRRHRGDQPVTGVIYTHSHGDHFGGVRGVVTDDVPILAPAGFLEHAVQENVYAGAAMNRRAVYMYGAELAKTAEGQIGAGLGMTTSTGTVSLIPPTVDITHTGQQETIDGVLIEFQLTPGTEAPAEMNFLFPERRALCMAENATHNLHNLLTLRGALVRDPRIWARYLTEAILLFGDRADVAFASHDLRFAAELLNHAVFANPAHEEAKQLLAATYDQLGYGAENGTWRNFYLMGALELRHGAIPPSLSLASPDMIPALTAEQLFDSIAIRVNGPKAWSQALTIDWDFTDESVRHRMTLSNGALIHWADPAPGDADLTLTLTKPQLLGMLAGHGLDGIQAAGDQGVLQRLLGLLDSPDPGFAIVTP
jgi:alkyl sulfatase BDS1-like metallo-beta-lactamase superfamily hydrolase